MDVRSEGCVRSPTVQTIEPRVGNEVGQGSNQELAPSTTLCSKAEPKESKKYNLGFQAIMKLYLSREYQSIHYGIVC